MGIRIKVWLTFVSFLLALPVAEATPPRQRVLVAGATGFLGRNLVPDLVRQGHRVTALGRDPGRLQSLGSQVHKVKLDLRSGEGLDRALHGVKTAYYLAHSMEGNSAAGFNATEAVCAENFAHAARKAGVNRVIFVGGIQPSGGQGNSVHLQSRQQVAEILARSGVPTTTLETSLIVGHKSPSITMLDALIRRLPVVALPPKVADARTQPVALSDMLHYLTGLLRKPGTAGGTFQVGGPDTVTYEQIVRGYSEALGKPRAVLRIPMPVDFAARYVMPLITGKPRGLVEPVIKGTHLSLPVDPRRCISRVFPERTQTPIQQALHQAARQSAQEAEAFDLGAVGSHLQAQQGSPGQPPGPRNDG
jgi:uncharacterized protein YbjT (DUF2867 family)